PSFLLAANEAQLHLQLMAGWKESRPVSQPPKTPIVWVPATPAQPHSSPRASWVAIGRPRWISPIATERLSPANPVPRRCCRMKFGQNTSWIN
ncbi:uncharacterized protein METZ01_LOCUS266514, partial [marine metagenome]